jgi:hypothetical protein
MQLLVIFHRRAQARGTFWGRKSGQRVTHAEDEIFIPAHAGSCTYLMPPDQRAKNSTRDAKVQDMGRKKAAFELIVWRGRE